MTSLGKMVQSFWWFSASSPRHCFSGSHPFSGSNQICSEENRLGSKHQRGALLVGPELDLFQQRSLFHPAQGGVRIIGHTDLNPNGKYLLISNHVSSADILAVFVLAKTDCLFLIF